MGKLQDAEYQIEVLESENRKLRGILKIAGIESGGKYIRTTSRKVKGAYIRQNEPLGNYSPEPEKLTVIDIPELPTDYEQTLEIITRERIEREVKQSDQDWINYTDNPLYVRRLLQLLRNGQDRVKSTGRDIRDIIGSLSNSVPSGMLPDEFRDHIQGQYDA